MTLRHFLSITDRTVVSQDRTSRMRQTSNLGPKDEQTASSGGTHARHRQGDAERVQEHALERCALSIRAEMLAVDLGGLWTLACRSTYICIDYRYCFLCPPLPGRCRVGIGLRLQADRNPMLVCALDFNPTLGPKFSEMRPTLSGLSCVTPPYHPARVESYSSLWTLRRQLRILHSSFKINADPVLRNLALIKLKNRPY